jgi:hypothetical protein
MKSEFDSHGAPRAPQDADRHASVSPRHRIKPLTIVGFASELGRLIGAHLAASHGKRCGEPGQSNGKAGPT